MAFPKDKSDSNGLDKKFGNAVAEDENSNNTGSKPKRIGTVNGRITTSKQSVSSLNRGVPTCRDEDY